MKQRRLVFCALLIFVSQVPVFAQDRTVAGSLAALNDSLQVALNGQQGVSYVLTGTWTATVQAQVSVDGQTWQAIDSYNFSTERVALNITANATYAISDLAGAGFVRIRVTSYTSGVVTVYLRAAQVAFVQNTKFDAVDKNTAPAHVATVAGIHNVTLPTVTDGQTVAVQSTSDGMSIVTNGPSAGGQTALSVALTSTLGSTVFAIKAAPGNLYGYHFFNAHTAVCYIQIFNLAAASVSLGTTVPVLSLGVPTANSVQLSSAVPLANFSVAMSAASTTTATGSTACTTVSVANFLYK